MIGSIVVGHLAAEYFAAKWIFWVAIIFGVFINMFALAWKFIKMDDKPKEKREVDEEQ